MLLEASGKTENNSHGPTPGNHTMERVVVFVLIDAYRDSCKIG